MNAVTPAGWTKLGERDLAGGRAIMALRVREASIGPKRILIDQYATWVAGRMGAERMRTFDDDRAAAEDFAARS
jgi:hypothetical protein